MVMTSGHSRILDDELVNLNLPFTGAKKRRAQGLTVVCVGENGVAAGVLPRALNYTKMARNYNEVIAESRGPQ